MPLADKLSWTQKRGKSAFDERYFIAGLCQNSKTLPWKTHHLWIPCYREVQSSLACIRNVFTALWDTLAGNHGTCIISEEISHCVIWIRRTRDGAVVRALVSLLCVPGSVPGLGVICGLSLLLVLFSSPRGFSPGTPVFTSPQKPTFPNPILDGRVSSKTNISKPNSSLESVPN